MNMRQRILRMLDPQAEQERMDSRLEMHRVQAYAMELDQTIATYGDEIQQLIRKAFNGKDHYDG